MLATRLLRILTVLAVAFATLASPACTPLTDPPVRSDVDDPDASRADAAPDAKLDATAQPDAAPAPQNAAPLADLVWPLSGTKTRAGRFSSTFGPRLKASENDSFDFHRGIDLSAPLGSPIYAVADGVVEIAGEHPGYDNTVVQLRHEDADGEVFYSNYLHLRDWEVVVGQEVRRGDVVAHTGRSRSGFEHLHFEIRRGEAFQHDCVHPLAYLRYDQQARPVIEDVRVDDAGPAASVTFTVTLPRPELDLNRVAVEVIDADTDEVVSIAEYDMTELNQRHEDIDVLENPVYQGRVRLEPTSFGLDDPTYRLIVTFLDLAAVENSRYRLVAEDVLGNRTTRMRE